MPNYSAPTRDIKFVLNDVLNVSQLADHERFAEATPDIVDGVVDEAARLIEEAIAPINQSGDETGCKWDDGTVTVPPGIDTAFRAYAENGWVGLSFDPEHGGQGLPYVLSKAVEDMLCGGNVAFALYPGLTQGCFEGIEANANDDIKGRYLEKLANGEWAGTMCMTEPHAGSDVGAVKTKATPQDDGSYRINGNKIFITSGEHDITDNIVHFVLVRLDGAPEGVKGLSTVVVPKFLPDGSRNGVKCLSIEEKMGIHASCTCTLAFDDAKGWLVGEPNQGIQNMFVMMNKARIMVGMQGLGLCELATQTAVGYALDRTQGKPMAGSAKLAQADSKSGDVAIIEHPDVRRMIFTMKAITEGARVMAYETSLAEDLSKAHPDADTRAEYADWVELGTPLVKAFCTDSAVDLGSMAIQVYGGHGFIREHGVEQIVRDAKILCLYEGTNGIQAMDLVRRKIKMKNGALPNHFFKAVDAALDAASGVDFITGPLRAALDELKTTTQWLQNQLKTDAEVAGAGAVPYLRAFSLTWLGYNWLRMVQAADGDSDFDRAKQATGRFFAAKLLPEVHSLCAGVRAEGVDLMALPADAFVAAA